MKIRDVLHQLIKESIKNASSVNIENAVTAILKHLDQRNEKIDSIFDIPTLEAEYKKLSEMLHRLQQQATEVQENMKYNYQNAARSRKNDELINAIASLILATYTKNQYLAETIKDQLSSLTKLDFGEPSETIFKSHVLAILTKNDTEAVREKARRIIEIFYECFESNRKQMSGCPKPITDFHSAVEEFKTSKTKIEQEFTIAVKSLQSRYKFYTSSVEFVRDTEGDIQFTHINGNL